MYPHPIQLREPWRRTGEADAPVLSRTFNAPTGLEPHEAVWLVIDRPSALAELHFNGNLLGAAAPAVTSEFEITPHLANGNEIKLQFPPTKEPAEFASVRLEIRLKSKH
ncbi:MAG: hypothetical protein WD030_03280 [Pirellulales bacterium]